MHNQITASYNKISDVFSKQQIKQAVEGLKHYKQRIQLIDYIIDRREQIEKSQDIAKMQQYAHVFKKMIQKYRKSKCDQDIQQKLQKIDMVMQLFQGEKKIKQRVETQTESQREIRYKFIREYSQQATILKSTNGSKYDESSTIDNSPIKQKKIQKFFTEKDPQSIENQVEGEVLLFLKKNKELNGFQKQRFLKLTDENYKFRYLEKKIKQELQNQEVKQLQSTVKEQYKVSNFFSRNYFQGHTIKIKQQNKEITKFSMPSLVQDNKNLENEQSFASYTEIKLNQLYNDSRGIQKYAQTSRSKRNSLIFQNLVQKNKDIISISNGKLFQIKKK